MTEAISDGAVLAALRPFVRAARPVLGALREADPFGLRSRVASGDEELDRTLRNRVLDALAQLEVPGTAAWAQMTVAERCRWWVHRVGRFTTLVASVPGLGGALADRLPLQPALGAAGQGLVLCAIAGEFGVTDEDEVVALLGAVLFHRDLRPNLAASAKSANAGQPDAPEAAKLEAEIDAKAAELTGELAQPRATPTLRRIAGAIWRLGRVLLALRDELDKRPHGRWYHSLVGMLPVVGMLGDYLGEWSGIKRAAQQGVEWLTHGGVSTGQAGRRNWKT